MPENKIKSNNSVPPDQSEGLGIFDMIWLSIQDIPKILRTLKFAVWIFSILAIFTLIGAILPQEHLSNDPGLFSQQYVNMFKIDPDDGVTTFGEMIYNGIVVPLELFNIFKSSHYYVLLWVLAISSMLCAWDRLSITRKLISRTNPKVKPETVKNMTYSSSGVVDTDAEAASDLMHESLRRRRFEVFKETDDSGTTCFFVRKNTFKHIVSVVFHFSFVLILIGGIIGDNRMFGFEGTIALMEGEALPVGGEDYKIREAEDAGVEYEPESPELIRLVEYENIYRESFFSGIDPETGFPLDYTGMPADFVSHLEIVIPGENGDDEILAERAIEVNHPLRHDGVSYYQSNVNTRLYFTVTVPGENPLPVITFQNRPFQIPGLGLVCTIQGWDIAGGIWEAEDGTRSELPYVVRLVDYSHSSPGHSGQPILLGYLTEDTMLTIDGVMITLDRIDEYTILSYRHDPGVPVVYLGSFLLILGLTVALYFPYGTGRIVISPGRKQTDYVIGGSWREFPELAEEFLKPGDRG